MTRPWTPYRACTGGLHEGDAQPAWSRTSLPAALDTARTAHLRPHGMAARPGAPLCPQPTMQGLEIGRVHVVGRCAHRRYAAACYCQPRRPVPTQSCAPRHVLRAVNGSRRFLLYSFFSVRFFRPLNMLQSVWALVVQRMNRLPGKQTFAETHKCVAAMMVDCASTPMQRAARLPAEWQKRVQAATQR